VLIPAEIIPDNILEESRYPDQCYPYAQRAQSRSISGAGRGRASTKCIPTAETSGLVDYGPPIGKVYIHSPEDLILYKLMYFGLSQQSKHSRDIAATLKSKKKELDLDYIGGWATRLGLSSLWKEMLHSSS